MAETIPGGYFLNPDKKSAHDANGNPVPLRSTDKLKQAEADAKHETEAEADTKTETPSKKK